MKCHNCLCLPRLPTSAGSCAKSHSFVASCALRGAEHFILDECDKMLEQLDMRRDVQEIFKNTPHEKQVSVRAAHMQAKAFIGVSDAYFAHIA